MVSAVLKSWQLPTYEDWLKSFLIPQLGESHSRKKHACKFESGSFPTLVIQGSTAQRWAIPSQSWSRRETDFIAEQAPLEGWVELVQFWLLSCFFKWKSWRQWQPLYWEEPCPEARSDPKVSEFMIKWIKGTSWGQPRVLGPGAIPLHSHHSKKVLRKRKEASSSHWGTERIEGEGVPICSSGEAIRGCSCSLVLDAQRLFQTAGSLPRLVSSYD